MWCAGSHRSRHLAVNRRVRSQSADSGVVRSHRVPNLKVPKIFVAFWDKRGRCPVAMLDRKSPPLLKVPYSDALIVAANATRPRSLPARRRIRDCATCHRQNNRKTEADRFRCDLRTAPEPASPAAVPQRHRIQPVVGRVLPCSFPTFGGVPTPHS